MTVETIAKELSFTSEYPSSIESESLPYNYKPLAAGDIAPSFTLSADGGLLSDIHSNSFSRERFISLHDFLDYGQPLLIFFSGAATRAALQAKQLEALQKKTEQRGGRLLILTPVALRHIKRQLKESGSLSVFHDRDNAIAEAFGLYNDQNPLWQWVSGIEEEEETLPGFYVIAPDRTITYRFVDFRFSLHSNSSYQPLAFMNELLEAVDNASRSYRQPERFSLVS